MREKKLDLLKEKIFIFPPCDIIHFIFPPCEKNFYLCKERIFINESLTMESTCLVLLRFSLLVKISKHFLPPSPMFFAGKDFKAVKYFRLSRLTSNSFFSSHPFIISGGIAIHINPEKLWKSSFHARRNVCDPICGSGNGKAGSDISLRPQ